MKCWGLYYDASIGQWHAVYTRPDSSIQERWFKRETTAVKWLAGKAEQDERAQKRVQEANRE